MLTCSLPSSLALEISPNSGNLQANVGDSKNILIYCQDDTYTGISKESVAYIESSIRALLATAEFIHIKNPDDICEKLKSASCLIWPGGECSKWDELLTVETKKSILQWYCNGGRILGICAGAYYCSAKSEFGLNLLRVREIQLFKGICRGPAFSNELEVVKVRWLSDQAEGYVAVIGGGYFIDENGSEASREILAEYTEMPRKGNPAVVKCTHEKGIGVLTGPHWEFGEDHFHQFELLFPWYANRIEEMRDNLRESAVFRQSCIKEMLTTLMS